MKKISPVKMAIAVALVFMILTGMGTLLAPYYTDYQIQKASEYEALQNWEQAFYHYDQIPRWSERFKDSKRARKTLKEKLINREKEFFSWMDKSMLVVKDTLNGNKPKKAETLWDSIQDSLKNYEKTGMKTLSFYEYKKSLMELGILIEEFKLEALQSYKK